MGKSFRITLFSLLLLVCCGFWQSTQARAAGTYMIKINKQQNVVTIYKEKDGKYKPHKAFVCSVGYATPTGAFSLGEKLRWHYLMAQVMGSTARGLRGVFYFIQSGITARIRRISRISSIISWEQRRRTAVSG